MSSFKIHCEWQAIENNNPLHQHSMAHLALQVGCVNLMQNQNIWSQKIEDSALLSAYPLAFWLASSWWRLNWEPLPPRGPRGTSPSVDWRMAHELGAADHGFVWPRIIFASDGDVMQIWAGSMNDTDQQSIRYLKSLQTPACVPLAEFQCEVEDFIMAVLSRLEAYDCPNTDLANLWDVIQADKAEQENGKYRRLEALMGYDPDECPQAIIDKALELGHRMGEKALAELIPIYDGKARSLADIEELAGSAGLIGHPQLPMVDIPEKQSTPWLSAGIVANEVRKAVSDTKSWIKNESLCDLLGLQATRVRDWNPNKRNYAALAVPDGNQYKFIPRKPHPIAKRFELARLLADCILSGAESEKWLTSTDLSTSRQKFQRAFAADFLCPRAALEEYLQDDFSESAIEDAAAYFQVSETLISNQLGFGDYVRLPY